MTAETLDADAVKTLVMTTVCTSYGVGPTAEELAEKLIRLRPVEEDDPRVFAFFSEVDLDLQLAFIAAMGVDKASAVAAAKHYAALAGYELPLCRASR